jgi:tetratricopeptide (TPR) repeat protein
LRDNALSEIVQAYVQAGQLDQALQVAEIMGEGFKFSTLLDISEKYRLARQPVRAASIIERADAVYRTLSKPNSTNLLANPGFKIFILPRLIDKYLAVGRKQRAVELSSELFEFVKTLPQQDYMTLSILSSTATVYEAAGQKDKATEVLDYSLEVVKNIKQAFMKAQALAQIANEYALLKQSVRASEVLSQALALAKPDKEVSSKNIVMITVARGYGVLGQYDKALEITKAVEPVSLRDQVKQAITCSKEAK